MNIYIFAQIIECFCESIDVSLCVRSLAHTLTVSVFLAHTHRPVCQRPSMQLAAFSNIESNHLNRIEGNAAKSFSVWKRWCHLDGFTSPHETERTQSENGFQCESGEFDELRTDTSDQLQMHQLAKAEHIRKK